MKKYKFLSIVALAVFSTFLFAQNANADILKVVSMTELYKCYTSYGKMLKTPGKIDSGLSMSKIASGGQVVMLTTDYGHDINDNNLSCPELIKGYGTKWKAVISTASDNMTQDNARQTLKSLGYEPGSGGGRRKNCVQKLYNLDTSQVAGIQYTQEQSVERTHQVCVSDVDENGKFTADSVASVNKIGNGTICDFDLADGNKTVQVDCANNAFWSRGGCGDVKITTGGTWSAFKKSIYNELAANRNEFTKIYAAEGYSATLTYRLQLNDEDHQGELDSDGSDLGVDWSYSGGTTSSAAIAMLKANSSWTSLGRLLPGMTGRAKSRPSWPPASTAT